MQKKWFITGTDTNIGKTITASVMLKKASNEGFNTAGYKPISTGCIKTKKGLRNDDALALKKNSSVKFDYNVINPFAFCKEQPPHILSKENGILIDYSILSNKLSFIQKKANWVMIEGIGGWYTPISEKYTLSEWVKIENIPVILVVGLKLGCINHAILTAKAILKSGVLFSGWIANFLSYENKYLVSYINIIKKYVNAPFLGKIPYIKNTNDISQNNINIKLPS